MDPVNTSAPLRFLTFRVGERLYALRSEDVAEVIRVPPVARIPQSPAALLGIGNLRGAMLPVISLRKLLNIAGTTASPHARAIVLDIGASVALVVDAVETLVTIASERIETRQAKLSAEPGERLTGALQATADGRVAKILDIKSLLEAAFARRARQERKDRHAVAADKVAQGSNRAKADMLVTFEVAGQEFALALDAVQEILPAPSTATTVPHAEAVVLGVTAFRDTLLPLLSLRGLLGFPRAQVTDAREKVVVMRIGGTRIGLVADRARAIVAAEPDMIDTIPAVLAARVGGEARIKAIYRGDAGKRLISILAPEQLFREDVMRQLGTDSRGQNTQNRQHEATRRDDLKYLVFRLGDDEFGLPIDAVDEVAQVPAQITRVPKTPKFLEGVVNLRGDVLPVVDQRRRFDMPRREQSEGRRLVVVRTDRHRAGIIVDSVSDVLRAAADSIEPPPDLTDETARLVRGVINLEKAGRIVLVLDPTELLTQAERGLLDAFQKETGRANA